MKKKLLLIIPIIFFMFSTAFSQVNMRYMLANWPWDMTIGANGTFTVNGTTVIAGTLTLSEVLNLAAGDTTEGLRVYDTDSDTLIINPIGFSSTNSNAAGTIAFQLKDASTNLLSVDTLGATIIATNLTLTDGYIRVDDNKGTVDLLRLVNDDDGSVGDSSFVVNKLGAIATCTSINTAGGLTVDGTSNLDDVDIDLSASLNIDGHMVDIGTGSYSVANGDNDLGVAGDVEIDGELELDGLLDGDGPAAALNNSLADSLEVTGTLEPSGDLLGAGTGATTDNTLADTLLVTGQVSGSTGFTDGTMTIDGSGAITAVTNLSMTTQLDMTGAGAIIDLNPAHTGTGTILDITPSAVLSTADAIWKGVFIDGNALDPSSTDQKLLGMEIDLSGVSQSGSGLYMEALGLKMPDATWNAIDIESGKIKHDLEIPNTAIATFSAYEISVDASSQAATSETHILEVSPTVTGFSGDIWAIGTEEEIGVIHQHVGAFSSVSQTEYAARKPASGSWTDGIDGNEIFVADNDTIIIGSASAFDALQVDMGTGATKTVSPEFYFYTSSTALTQFFPVDDTEGFQEDGFIRWESGDLTSWASNADPGAADGSSGYYISIVRTSNADPGTPTPTTIKTGVGTEYTWDANGDISIVDLALGGLLDGNGTAAALNNTLADTLNLTGALETTDGTDTYNTVVTSDEYVIQNDAGTPLALVEIDSLNVMVIYRH
jgi:hypothetical protein